jgi:hypothetical protein
MKLQYRILWFDDNDDFFNSLDWDFLRDRVAEWGFEPDVKLVTTPETFLGEAPYADYDLMVVDFNLEGYGEGQDFIRKVREQEVFTEIIFYSSNATTVLWDAVRSHQLEGIYVASRDTVQDRILQVGHQSLRKVLDLDNMRGIVMAEVGDLDLLLGKIIGAAIGGLDEDTRQGIFKRFYEKSCEHHSSLKTGLDEFMAAPTVELLLSLCDSNKRWQNFNRVHKRHELLKGRTFGDYAQEILTPRNCLAHGVPIRRDDGRLVFRHQATEYEFSEAVGTALRRKIIEYKNVFSEVEKAFSGG